MSNNRKKIKDYNKQKREIKNPFVKRKRKKRNWKKITLIFLSLLLIIVAFWWLFLSGFWNINQIKVQGSTRVPEENIKNLAWEQTKNKIIFNLNQENLFLLNSKQLIETLQNKYHFPEVEIKKRIPNKIYISITENKLAYILQENNKYYKIDKAGYVIESQESIATSTKEIFLLENQGNQNRVVGDKVYIDRNYINYISDLNRLINQKTSEIEIKSFVLDSQASNIEGLEEATIEIIIINGPTIYLNMKEAPEGQIKKLILIKQHELEQGFMDKEYIILKYGDRIFYK